MFKIIRVFFDVSRVEQRRGVLTVVLKLHVLILQRRFTSAFCLRCVNAHLLTYIHTLAAANAAVNFCNIIYGFKINLVW